MRLAILITMAATATGLRSVVLVRHGISEMNVALARRPWGSPGFADPDIRDAPLTPEGLAGAERLRGTIGDVGAVDLVVSSPLTRALQTSAAVFRDAGVPAVATPLAAERCYLSSDVGAPTGAYVPSSAAERTQPAAEKTPSVECSSSRSTEPARRLAATSSPAKLPSGPRPKMTIKVTREKSSPSSEYPRPKRSRSR